MTKNLYAVELWNDDLRLVEVEVIKETKSFWYVAERSAVFDYLSRVPKKRVQHETKRGALEWEAQRIRSVRDGLNQRIATLNKRIAWCEDQLLKEDQ